tara:strand:+ start:1868 stop:2119 length:252 start_codon:yes stop_codon:yes gene_type:complete
MEVEFRIIDTSEMPPIVITQNENDEPKVVINTYHKLWISLNRRVIAGIVEALQEKMDMILTGFLKEQYEFEKDDRYFNNQPEE